MSTQITTNRSIVYGTEMPALKTAHSLSSALHRARTALAKEQVNQALALRLLKPRAKDRALLQTALIYLNKNDGKAVNRRIVSAVIEQQPIDRLLQMIAEDAEGAAIFNLVNGYLNRKAGAFCGL